MLAGDYEVAVLEEGKTLDYPVLGLISFIILPLLGREEVVAVGHFEVLT